MQNAPRTAGTASGIGRTGPLRQVSHGTMRQQSPGHPIAFAPIPGATVRIAERSTALAC